MCRVFVELSIVLLECSQRPGYKMGTLQFYELNYCVVRYTAVSPLQLLALKQFSVLCCTVIVQSLTLYCH